MSSRESIVDLNQYLSALTVLELKTRNGNYDHASYNSNHYHLLECVFVRVHRLYQVFFFLHWLGVATTLRLVQGSGTTSFQER